MCVSGGAHAAEAGVSQRVCASGSRYSADDLAALKPRVMSVIAHLRRRLGVYTQGPMQLCGFSNVYLFVLFVGLLAEAQ